MGTVDIDLGKSGDPTPPFSRSGPPRIELLDLDCLMAAPYVDWNQATVVRDTWRNRRGQGQVMRFDTIRQCRVVRKKAQMKHKKHQVHLNDNQFVAFLHIACLKHFIMTTKADDVCDNA